MNLWIRSQDKRTLVNTRRIDVDDNKIIIWDEGKYASDVFMGEYKTKERALEVLDEIHQRLTDLQTLEIAHDFRSTRNMDCVYEMPQE